MLQLPTRRHLRIGMWNELSYKIVRTLRDYMVLFLASFLLSGGRLYVFLLFIVEKAYISLSLFGRVIEMKTYKLARYLVLVFASKRNVT